MENRKRSRVEARRLERSVSASSAAGPGRSQPLTRSGFAARTEKFEFSEADLHRADTKSSREWTRKIHRSMEILNQDPTKGFSDWSCLFSCHQM